MDGVRDRFVWGALAYVAVVVAGRDVKAQGTPVAGYPATTSSAYGNGMGMVMGMGMGMMPMMYAMNPTASLSPTDAAALGMQSQGNAGAAAMNGIFRNPMAAPYMFGSEYPMSPGQMGTLMLANQAGMTGIGSGQLSGVRPGAGSSRGKPGPPAAKPRGPNATPGGLAARYFNRTAHVMRYPQSYYNRQNRYFPQTSH